MSCEVTVLADSIAPSGSRLISVEVEHWQPIHREVIRHRAGSYSAASSRAIPGASFTEYAEVKPGGPLVWTTKNKGMQGGEPLDATSAEFAQAAWDRGREAAIDLANYLISLGVHKSIANRPIETFANIRCVITANWDDWHNFFAQRLHWDAEPAMQQLAKRIALAIKASTPRELIGNQWHLPYIMDAERLAAHAADPDEPAMVEVGLAKLSAARCARVSYKTHDGKVPTVAEDLDLYERLVGSDPKHASPTEHQAAAYDWPQRWYIPHVKGEPWKYNGNLGPGWIQHRKLIAGERATAASFDLDARLRAYEGVDFLLEEPH